MCEDGCLVLGMTAGDDGCSEGLAIGQPRTRMRPSRLMVGGKITERLMVVVSRRGRQWLTVRDRARIAHRNAPIGSLMWLCHFRSREKSC